MRIPYGFTLVSSGMLEVNRSEADVVRMIFDYYMAGASLGKVVDMLYIKKYPPRREKRNGLVQQLITCYPMANTLLSLGWKSSWTHNLKSPLAAILTTTRKAHLGKKHVTSRPPWLRCNFSFLFLQDMLQ